MERRKRREGESGRREWTHLRSLVVAQRWHVTTEDRAVGHCKISVPPEREEKSKRDDKIKSEI